MELSATAASPLAALGPGSLAGYWRFQRAVAKAQLAAWLPDPRMLLVDISGPYASAPRMFVIVDNGSDHRGKAAINRLAKAHPNAIMIHTPVHASWLNQIEIFFSIIQKKVISPNDFASPGDLSGTLLAFVDRYNQTARPFNWNYTATDLARYLGQINGQQQPASLPEAA